METYFTDTGSYPTGLPTDAKVSTGNTVTVETAGAAAGTYCLKATSPKSSGDWFYDSDKGGLLAKDVACS